MFYQLATFITRWVFRLINGKPIVYHKDRVPNDQPVIFAGTHRSNVDPFVLIHLLPDHTIAFMAKQELFQFKPLGKLLSWAHVFPVDRQKPSIKSLRQAIDLINKEQLDLGIFPTGTRYDTVVKGGTAFIHRMTKAPIVPVGIIPPRGVWQFITRKRPQVIFGEPIYYDTTIKYNKEKLAAIDQQLAQQFDQLTHQLDPDFPSHHTVEE